MKQPLILVTTALTLATATIGVAALVDDFEKKPGIAVFQPENSGATVSFEQAPEARGMSAKIAWTKVPPKGLMHITWPDGSRPVLDFAKTGEIGGTFKLQLWTDDPAAIKRIDVRVKDAQGESFTWGTDVKLEAKKWQEVTVDLRPGTEATRRSDKPGRENGKLDAPVTLAHLGLVLRSDAAAGSVLMDDVHFEPAPPTTKPSAAN